MKLTSTNTYEVNIYCGLKEGYDGEITPFDQALNLVQEYCDQVGLGVTMTETCFVYTGGREPGVIVGLINYPRFPMEKTEIFQHALKIAKKLRQELEQERVTIVTPEKTYLIGP